MYREKRASSAWEGYSSQFDTTKIRDYYARMDEQTVYFHGVVSGFVDGQTFA